MDFEAGGARAETVGVGYVEVVLGAEAGEAVGDSSRVGVVVVVAGLMLFLGVVEALAGFAVGEEGGGKEGAAFAEEVDCRGC